jgi:glutathione S-transferase
MAAPVLWHIEVSHYNEKARWALDYKGVPHRRRAPTPGVLHPVVALAKTRKVTFPVLDIDGESIGDSTRIIETLERRYPDPPLYPSDPDERRRALELEDYFDEEVAPYMRRLMFWQMSRDRERSAAALRTLGAPVLPGPLAAPTVALVARRYGGNAANMDDARAHAVAGFDRVLAEVGPSGYMVGDSFTVADLTAASILYHLAEPPEFQYEIPDFPPAVYEFRDSLPPESLEWIRRMWRDHRPASAEIAAA